MLVKRSAGTNGMKYRETLQAACRSYNRIRYRRGNNNASRSHTAKLERSEELGLSRREREWNTTKQVHVLPSKLVKNIAHRIVDMKTFEKEIEDGVVMAACEESSIFVQSVPRGTIQWCLVTFSVRAAFAILPDLQRLCNQCICLQWQAQLRNRNKCFSRVIGSDNMKNGDGPLWFLWELPILSVLEDLSFLEQWEVQTSNYSN